MSSPDFSRRRGRSRRHKARAEVRRLEERLHWQSWSCRQACEELAKVKADLSTLRLDYAKLQYAKGVS